MSLCIGALVCGCAGTRSAHEASAHDAPAVEQSEAGAPASSPDQRSGWITTPLPVISEPVAVKEGSAPLAYLVEAGGTFRVHDRTTGQDLARARAPGRSIVRVDARRGVVFDGETLVPGPLEQGHRYVIYRDPTGPNFARQGVFQLQPRRGASAQSGGETGTPDESNLQDGGQEAEGGPDVER